MWKKRVTGGKRGVNTVKKREKEKKREKKKDFWIDKYCYFLVCFYIIIQNEKALLNFKKKIFIMSFEGF